ncbi:MAG: acetoacetate--CoA ligase [Actinobacteria bacterium]|nr:acetoacetate--CoA ligase [Actinomycetota bacterium]MBO0786550.1 acetoacetate--CoA ligase [Actinomycetota bacterium]MBO0813799.1 acetoacetate--CoA ligase [Actinomycetota bacterium]
MSTGQAAAGRAPVRDGDLLWTPGPEVVEGANVSAFMRWLAAERGREFTGFHELYRWSVEDLPGFWQAVWDYCGVTASVPPERPLGRREMPGAEWFPGARLNYAEHVLRNEQPGTDALLYRSESTPLAAMDWADLAGQVRVLATRLREFGVRPGDRVVSCLPNVPHTIIAMLATTSIGAIWAGCSPDFGWRGVLDRFSQLEPVVMFCPDGYAYGGKEYDRLPELAEIIAGLPSLRHVIMLPRLRPDRRELPAGIAMTWDEALDHPPVAAADFRFEQVGFSHPLWILFSSGTTGLPKPIVHGHGGILLEQFKLQTFHMDLRRGERMFFYTTTGWMMWNFLASSLLLGVCPVLYDGNPAYPHPGVLWETAEQARVSLFGASPSYVDALSRAGVVPGDRYHLPDLRVIVLAGSPVSAECGAWFYRNVKRDLWLATGSGGTDTCCGLVGGVPVLPVYAGEIQAPHLGVSVKAFNDRGESVTGEVGEMVITEPMPSMPVCLWGDADGSRYRESYFAEFPGVWRQGDFFMINARGGCFVLGRSDATLNRHGVRIGTAEIYAVLASIDEIEDALIVNLDLPGGGFFMPLFVKLAGGRRLDGRLRDTIAGRLRQEYTPRHVPDTIIQVRDIPVTLTGKKMEVPVRRILQGMPPEAAANVNAMANPGSLAEYSEYARSQQDFPFRINPGVSGRDGSG